MCQLWYSSFQLILKEVFDHQVSGKDAEEQLIRLQQERQSTAKYSMNFKHWIGCEKWMEWDSTENHVLAWIHRSATEWNTMPSSSALTQPIYSASHLHNSHSTNPPSKENYEVESKETVIWIRRASFVEERNILEQPISRYLSATQPPAHHHRCAPQSCYHLKHATVCSVYILNGANCTIAIFSSPFKFSNSPKLSWQWGSYSSITVIPLVSFECSVSMHTLNGRSIR